MIGSSQKSTNALDLAARARVASVLWTIQALGQSLPGLNLEGACLEIGRDQTPEKAPGFPFWLPFKTTVQSFAGFFGSSSCQLGDIGEGRSLGAFPSVTWRHPVLEFMKAKQKESNHLGERNSLEHSGVAGCLT